MTITLRSVKGTPLSDAEADGNVSDLVGRVEGWNDLVQPVIVRSGAPSAPSIGLFRDGIWAYEFSPTDLNECFVNFHLGHDYVAGSMVYPHVHWSPSTTSTGTVRWCFEYTWARRGDSTGQLNFPATQTLVIESNIASNSQYKHMVNESTDGNGIPGSTMETDALVLCRVYRDGAHPNDTFPDVVSLLTADIHYQSNTKSTPLRTPPFL